MGGFLSACDYFDVEDYDFLEEASGTSANGWGARIGAAELVAELASHVLEGDVAAFELALERDDALTRLLLEDESFRRLTLLGLSYGVAREDPTCANYLGALYYMGSVVPLDYRRAKELYELADAGGLAQGMVNLGYVYEYGRVGEPDYVRAYMQYAKAAALFGHHEALCKLGDMYARGKAVERDLRTALALWDRSLSAAKDEMAQAQPAFRIAELICDSANEGLGLPYDPLGALRLYQLAERGLMAAIAAGETCYRGRLAETIEGQERMRAVLRAPGGERYLG